MIKILLSIYLLLSSFVLFAQGLFENDPIWRDEFNRDNVPSSMYWSYIVGMRGQESEYYTNSSNNVCVNNGKLIIRTLDEKKDKALCTSGRIHTLGKVSFLYGRLEIKAKCPTGKGVWPAFWMLPAEEGLPFGEIDIIVKDNKYIVFVEVKTRDAKSISTPLEAVTFAKKKKLIQTALLYLQEHPDIQHLQPRFDVAGMITTGKNKEIIEIQYITNAFNGGGLF